MIDAEVGCDVDTFLLARSMRWLGHTRRRPLVAPSDRSVTPSSPSSKEEAAPEWFVPWEGKGGGLSLFSVDPGQDLFLYAG